MQQTICLQLNGANAAEVARILAARLAEFQCRADVETSSSPAKCAVRIAAAAGRPAEDLVVELDPYDTPDFAAEKAIDMLAERRVVSLPSADYTREEEETIRRRLHELGYIE